MDDFGIGIDVRTKEGRVTTGMEGLDKLIEGGFPQGSVTLISGTPGTGKTIMCFQYIWKGVQNGEKCLYLSSDERIDNLINLAKRLGFDFQPLIEKGLLKFMYLNSERSTVHEEMEHEIRSGQYSRVVLDSLTPLAEVPVWIVNKGKEIIPSSEGGVSTASYPLDSIQATRIHIRRIMSILGEDANTTLVTTEIPEGSRDLSRDSISEFLVDGILVLDLDTTMDRRKITIRKMRGTRHTLKPQDIEISEQGIHFRQ
jgi:circadian clock protein KaiC